MKVTLIPIVIGVYGTIPFVKRLEELEIEGLVGTNQTGDSNRLAVQWKTLS